MRVRFRQTGGYAGLSRGCELDTSSMAAGDAKTLERLVRASGIGGRAASRAPGARDAAQYVITVEDEGGAVTAAFDDTSAPKSARELLEFLQARSGPRPLD